jgi:hypothetical protein
MQHAMNLVSLDRVSMIPIFWLVPRILISPELHVMMNKYKARDIYELPMLLHKRLLSMMISNDMALFLFLEITFLALISSLVVGMTYP